MATTAPLSEGEIQWLKNFERKLDELHNRSDYSTAFLDPRQLELAEVALAKYKTLSYTVYGGYHGAERNMVRVFSAQHQPQLPRLEALVVSWSGTEQIGHRDLLGAVMSLGLRRDQVGDIIFPGEKEAALFVGESRANHLATELTQVGKVVVNCSAADPQSLAAARDEGREIRGTVASLRVDSVLSLGFGLSRSRVVLLVKGGLVRVNWRPVSSPSHQLSEGDQVSLRGRGRLVIERVEGETRKGRIRLTLKKYA